MRNPWHQIPVVRLLLPVIAGIVLWLCADSVHANVSGISIIAGVLLGASILFSIGYAFVNVTLQYRLRIINGIALTTALIAAGYLLSVFYAAPNRPAYYGNIANGETVFVAEICEPPIEKEKTINAIAQVRQVDNNGLLIATEGKIFLSFLKGTDKIYLNYGDVIVANAAIQSFNPPMNPGEFDYRRYQQLHNIYYRAFLTTGAWQRMASGKGNWFFTQVYKVRKAFLHVIEAYITDDNDLGVATAMMLGYRGYMNDETIQAYSASGAMHILSVSGLHVGIVFLALSWLLSWVDERNRRAVLAKTAVIIFFIWLYACLTGLSPSVLRAAAMFSLLAIGKVSLRNNNTYNILAGSALLIILFNPFIIAEVGFQLSYAAVLGIVFLQPVIAGWLTIGSKAKPKYKSVTWYKKPFYFLRYDVRWFLYPALPNWIWQLTCVSVAAQIATAPLSLYYFHQFPNLFIVANILVIPLCSVVMFSGMALFAVSFIPYISAMVAWVFSHSIMLLNQITFGINQLPFALWQGISISLMEVMLLYLIILLICTLTEVRRPKVFIIALLLSCCLLVYNVYEGNVQTMQHKFVVYSVPHQSAIAVINGRNVNTLFDETLLKDTKNMKYHIQPHWWMCGADMDTAHTAELQMAFGKVINCYGKTVLVVDKEVQSSAEIGEKLPVDVLVISNNANVNVATLNKIVDYKQVVFDTSNKPKQIAALTNAFSAQRIPIWNVNTQGAFIMNM